MSRLFSAHKKSWCNYCKSISYLTPICSSVDLCLGNQISGVKFNCCCTLAFWDRGSCTSDWTGSPDVPGDGLERLIFLLAPSRCWGYRCEPPGLHGAENWTQGFVDAGLALSLLNYNQPCRRVLSYSSQCPLCSPGGDHVFWNSISVAVKNDLLALSEAFRGVQKRHLLSQASAMTGPPASPL